ncbi:MAG TPA: nuclear transport factor 2 family protein [Longimicrobium sp.]|jgi:ketosteroid isomerase-like protein
MRIFPTPLAVLALAACTSSPPPAPPPQPSSAAGPVMSGAAPGDTCNHVTYAADVEAARAAYVAAWQGGDPQAVARFFTDDARVQTTDETFTGRDAILRGWISKDIGKVGALRLLAHVANYPPGEVIDAGTAMLRFRQADGTFTEERATYRNRWVRQPDGSWRLREVVLHAAAPGLVC